MDGRVGRRRRDDVIGEAEDLEEAAAAPPQALAQHDGAQPSREGGLVSKCSASQVRRHECLLHGVFRRAPVVQDKIRESEHRARVRPEQLLEASSPAGSCVALFVHARQLNRVRVAPK